MAQKPKLLSRTDTYQTALTKYFTLIDTRATLIVLESQGRRVLEMFRKFHLNSADIRLNLLVILRNLD